MPYLQILHDRKAVPFFDPLTSAARACGRRGSVLRLALECFRRGVIRKIERPLFVDPFVDGIRRRLLSSGDQEESQKNQQDDLFLHSRITSPWG